jgi:flagellar protein FliL
MAEEKQDQEKNKENPRAKGHRKWMVLAIVILVLGGGGTSAWLYLGKAGGDKGTLSGPASNSRETGKTQRQAIIYPLDAFIVNLMDKSHATRRYLKVTMALEVDGEASRAMADKHKIHLRDTIILLLSDQGFEDISTVEGKLGLKQEIQSRINQILGTGVVNTIYFTEFVVQ